MIMVILVETKLLISGLISMIRAALSHCYVIIMIWETAGNEKAKIKNTSVNAQKNIRTRWVSTLSLMS